MSRVMGVVRKGVSAVAPDDEPGLLLAPTSTTSESQLLPQS